MLKELVFLVCIFHYVQCEKCRIQVLETNDYVGCFVDTMDRLLPYKYVNRLETEKVESHSELENNRCILHCRGVGTIYAGTEKSGECYCGNNPWRYTADDVNHGYILNYNCDSVCLGDTTQICGGGWRLSVYHTGWSNDIMNKLPANTEIKHVIIELTVMDRTIDENKQLIASSFTSKTRCAVLCLVDRECSGIVYSKVKGSCRLYQLTYEDLCDYIMEEEGSVIYMNKIQ